MSEIVRISNLEKTYRTDSETLTILKNLNLSIEEGTKAVIVGYGRIGSMLADRLALLGASVTVAARRAESRAEARARGHRAVDVTELPADPDAVINTVPAPILSGDFGGALCVELASAPGGWTDHTPVLRAPGLPGLYAPRAAADVMADAVYRVMEVDIIE